MTQPTLQFEFRPPQRLPWEIALPGEEEPVARMIGGAVLVGSETPFATSSSWTSATNGTWVDAANWSAGIAG